MPLIVPNARSFVKPSRRRKKSKRQEKWAPKIDAIHETIVCYGKRLQKYFGLDVRQTEAAA